MRLLTLAEIATVPLVVLLSAPAATEFARLLDEETASEPQVVEIAPGEVAWREPGEFLDRGFPVAAPQGVARFDAPLTVMRRQVTRQQYEACVADGGCRPAEATGPQDGPVNGVDHFDAQAYAAWLSANTGWRWRLPTAAEWAFFARERFGGETAVFGDSANPAVAWLRRYREEAARARKADPTPKPGGSYGVNSAGVEDLAGNVWEWTSTCYTRTSLGGQQAIAVENCGIRVVEGRHRAYMTDFIRDGKSGGCAVGSPPDNLGIRLVREPKSLASRLRDWFARS